MRVLAGWPGASRRASRGAFKVQGFSGEHAHAGACKGARNAKIAPVIARVMVALGLGVLLQLACDLPSARASATTFSTIEKFKENKEVPKEV